MNDPSDTSYMIVTCPRGHEYKQVITPSAIRACTEANGCGIGPIPTNRFMVLCDYCTVDPGLREHNCGEQLKPMSRPKLCWHLNVVANEFPVDTGEPWTRMHCVNCKIEASREQWSAFHDAQFRIITDRLKRGFEPDGSESLRAPAGKWLAADRITVNSWVRLTLRERLLLLFRPLCISVEVYTQHEPGKTEAVTVAWAKRWRWPWKATVGLEWPQPETEKK